MRLEEDLRHEKEQIIERLQSELVRMVQRCIICQFSGSPTLTPSSSPSPREGAFFEQHTVEELQQKLEQLLAQSKEKDKQCMCSSLVQSLNCLTSVDRGQIVSLQDQQTRLKSENFVLQQRIRRESEKLKAIISEKLNLESNIEIQQERYCFPPKWLLKDGSLYRS